LWGGKPVGRIAPSGSVFNPDAELIGGALGNPNLQTLAVNRMRDFLRAEVTTKLEPLTKLKSLSESTDAMPSTRGFAFSLLENFGYIDRAKQGQIVRDLDQDARRQLREIGAYFGQYTVFLREMIKPKPATLLSLLLAYGAGGDKKPFIPFAGMTSIPNEGDLASDNYSEQAIAIAGYRACGPRIIRFDILDRLSGLVRQAMNEAGGRKFQIMQEMLALLGSSYEDARGVLSSLGYNSEKVTVKSKEGTQVQLESERTHLAADTHKDQNGTHSEAQSLSGESDTQAKPATSEASKPVTKPQAPRLNPYVRRTTQEDGTMIEMSEIELWHMPFKKRNGHGSTNNKFDNKRKTKGKAKQGFKGKNQNGSRDDNRSSRPKKPTRKLEDSPFAALAALKSPQHKD